MSHLARPILSHLTLTARLFSGSLQSLRARWGISDEYMGHQWV